MGVSACIEVSLTQWKCEPLRCPSKWTEVLHWTPDFSPLVRKHIKVPCRFSRRQRRCCRLTTTIWIWSGSVQRRSLPTGNSWCWRWRTVSSLWMPLLPSIKLLNRYRNAVWSVVALVNSSVWHKISITWRNGWWGLVWCLALFFYVGVR